MWYDRYDRYDTDPECSARRYRVAGQHSDRQPQFFFREARSERREARGDLCPKRSGPSAMIGRARL